MLSMEQWCLIGPQCPLTPKLCGSTTVDSFVGVLETQGQVSGQPFPAFLRLSAYIAQPSSD